VIRELFRLDTSRLESEVASLVVQQSSSASTLSKFQKEQTAQLQDSIARLEKTVLNKVTELDLSPETQASSVRNTISNAVTRAVKECLSGVWVSPEPDSRITSTSDNYGSIRRIRENRELQYRENHQILELQPASDDRSTCASNKSPRQSPRDHSHKCKRRSVKFCQTYNTLIGTIFIQVFDVVLRCGDECGQSTDPAKSQELIFEFSFVPRAWLFRRGMFLTALWEHQCPNSQISIQLRPQSIVSSDSAIFRACRAGDIKEMQILFEQGKATPYDMTDGGRTLLWVSQRTKSKIGIRNLLLK
jgi:hypothetical protein